MKYQRLFVLTILLLVLTILAGFIVERQFFDCRKKILSDSDFLFVNALSNEHNRRLVNNEYYYLYTNPNLSPDWPKEKIIITTKYGEKTQTNIDSIRALSEEDKIKMLRETMLLSVDPINPDSLNAFFSRLLKERGVSVFTGVKYHEVDSPKIQYSGRDTAFFATSYPLTERRMGVFNEIVVQPYVQVPFTTVVGKAGVKLFIPFLFWLVVFGIFIIYIIYLIMYRDKEEVSLSDVEQIRQILQVDVENSCLYAKGQTVALTPSFVRLFSRFLEKDDLSLTKKEVANCLWENDKLQHLENRLSQMMHRARKTIAFIEELQIETVRGRGYRLSLKKH